MYCADALTPGTSITGAVCGTDKRHRPWSADGAWKNGSVCSPLARQSAAAAALSITVTCAPKAETSALMRVMADCTAATAPRKRTNKKSATGCAVLSRTHALAFNGRGWPPQRCKSCKASGCAKPWHIKVASAGANGKTFKLTSVITPKVPQLPAIKRLTS